MRIGLRRTNRVCRETIRVFLLVAIRFRKGKIKRGEVVSDKCFEALAAPILYRCDLMQAQETITFCSSVYIISAMTTSSEMDATTNEILPLWVYTICC